MKDINVCVYDNPEIMHRECWENGELIYSYSYILFLHKVFPLPAEYFFFAANVGEWETGKLHCGTLDAMKKG